MFQKARTFFRVALDSRKQFVRLIYTWQFVSQGWCHRVVCDGCRVKLYRVNEHLVLAKHGMLGVLTLLNQRNVMQ